MQVRSFSIALVTVSMTAMTASAAPKSATPKGPHGNPHTTAPATTSKPTSTTRVIPPNPIAQKIASKPNLSSKIQAMLPGTMTLDQASRGFKNQGQFIAALHVSQNLGIPFADLKAAMTGLSPTAAPGTQPSGKTLSLGQAIHKLRPTADAESASRTAEREATHDVETTSHAPAPPKKTRR